MTALGEAGNVVAATFRMFVASLLLGFCGCAGGLRDAAPQYPQLPVADIYLLGEVHDNAAHHETQAAYLRRLNPVAVAFEMLTPTQAVIVNSAASRGATLAEALGWRASGWPDWALYQPVFAALGDARVYGMALPGSEVRRAVAEGAAAVFEGDAEAYGLHMPLPEAQREQREAEQLSAHCNMLPGELVAGMVEAQRLRDAAFARAALQALSETGGPVAVITGSGHARRDWGMPAAISIRAPAVRVSSLGQLEGTPEGVPPFDLWLVAEPAPREDPCKAFE